MKPERIAALKVEVSAETFITFNGERSGAHAPGVRR